MKLRVSNFKCTLDRSAVTLVHLPLIRPTFISCFGNSNTEDWIRDVGEFVAMTVQSWQASYIIECSALFCITFLSILHSLNPAVPVPSRLDRLFIRICPNGSMELSYDGSRYICWGRQITAWVNGKWAQHKAIYYTWVLPASWVTRGAVMAYSTDMYYCWITILVPKVPVMEQI